MPAADVLATIPAAKSLNQIIEFKRRWRVSLMSLLRRLHQLETISDWQYRMMCIQAAELGYRQSEPFGIEREQSVVWQKGPDGAVEGNAPRKPRSPMRIAPAARRRSRTCCSDLPRRPGVDTRRQHAFAPVQLRNSFRDVNFMLDAKHKSSHIRGMNKLPLAKRVQILSLLCEGIVHAGDLPRRRRVDQHRRQAAHGRRQGVRDIPR